MYGLLNLVGGLQPLFDGTTGSSSLPEWTVFSGILNNITSNITISTLATYLGGMLAICIPFVVFWFIYRKSKAAVRGAVTKGKM